MRRRLFTLLSVGSLVLCVLVCVLWAVRFQFPRVGDGWFILGSRYTLSLSPDRMAIVGPPSSDPAGSQQVGELAAAMRAHGGTLRYHGTTGGMGFRYLDFSGEAPDPRVELAAREIGYAPPSPRVVDNSCIPMLMAALESEQFFLLAHALLSYTKPGKEAGDHPQWHLDDLQKVPGQPGHWTGVYDGICIDLIEDRHRYSTSTWGDEIWAVVTPSRQMSSQRADVCRRWHERFDVPLGTVGYLPAGLCTLAVPAVRVAAHVAGCLRRGKRQAGDLCPNCGYDLRASPGRCPECGDEPDADGKSAGR